MLKLSGAVLVLMGLVVAVTTLTAQPFQFKLVVIDNNYNDGTKPGWSRMSDVDRDGFIDVVAGGGNHIAWYKNPYWSKASVWKKSVIGAAGCNGGVLFDVDRDGDPDVLTSVKTENHKVFWFENPNQRYPKNQNKEQWTRRIVDPSSGLTFQHDLEVADMDMDGVPDDFVVLFDNYQTKSAIIKWYRMPEDPVMQKWEIFDISKGQAGGVGLAVGDIDGDGRNDLVRGGKWYRGPIDVDGGWREHTITDRHLTNVRTADLDGDGDLDIAASGGWDDQGAVLWLENKQNGSNFAVHNIATLYHPENMVILDLNGDGHYEIITGEMKGEEDSNFIVFENRTIRQDSTWEKHIVSDNHGISARMNALDVDADGDMDIVSDGNAQTHIYLWINETPIERSNTIAFKFNNIDNNYAPGWARAADMDGDNDIDIVAGGGKNLFVYENDGKEESWTRHGSLEATDKIGCNAAELFDVDRDGDLDILAAMKYKELGWWENPGSLSTGKFWTYHTYHAVDNYYLHDMIVADVDRDGRAEEFITNTNSGYWHSSVKLHWYKIADDPRSLWHQYDIEAGRKETFHGHAGLDFDDINADGIMDVSYSNGWYEGKNTKGIGWQWHQVSQIYGISNNLIRDMDGDGDKDLVMSAGHHSQGVYWFENSGGKSVALWKQHTIDALVNNPEGMQVTDIDNDGDPDVIAAELFFGEGPQEPDWDDDAHNVYLYENLDGTALKWRKSNLAPNTRPSHTLQLIDVNKDGKLDIIAESSGAPGVIYMENISR